MSRLRASSHRLASLLRVYEFNRNRNNAILLHFEILFFLPPHFTSSCRTASLTLFTHSTSPLIGWPCSHHTPWWQRRWGAPQVWVWPWQQSRRWSAWWPRGVSSIISFFFSLFSVISLLFWFILWLKYLVMIFYLGILIYFLYWVKFYVFTSRVYKISTSLCKITSLTTMHLTIPPTWNIL